MLKVLLLCHRTQSGCKKRNRYLEGFQVFWKPFFTLLPSVLGVDFEDFVRFQLV